MGTGDIAGTMTETLQSVGSPVVAVGSGSAERAQAFAARYGISHAVGSHQAVAERDDVDIVYVATTHDLHYQNVLDAVAGGKAVLCEKALALNAREAVEMYGAAAAAGVVLMEAMWMRFCPFIATLDELIAGGAIGEATDVEVFFGYVPPQSRRWTNRRLGGGSLLDLGVYSLSLVHHVLGSPQSFEAMAQLDGGVDVDVRVISHHEGEASATAGADVPRRSDERSHRQRREGAASDPRSVPSLGEDHVGASGRCGRRPTTRASPATGSGSRWLRWSAVWRPA